MKQKPFKCDYYSKRNDDSARRQSNRIIDIEVKVTDIEKDGTIVLKRIR